MEACVADFPPHMGGADQGDESTFLIAANSFSSFELIDANFLVLVRERSFKLDAYFSVSKSVITFFVNKD